MAIDSLSISTDHLSGYGNKKYPCIFNRLRNALMSIKLDNSKIIVLEFIRRINEGSTKPYLCRCDDGNLYVVKSMPMMPPKHLLAEFISACLANHLGLPLPDLLPVD
ncbi:HipA family kinase [Pantoea ananatis]|uniref:HipA family kinase n=1 Tax=Pantoea ananas TaxID=553 RepID=UPI0030C65EA2